MCDTVCAPLCHSTQSYIIRQSRTHKQLEQIIIITLYAPTCSSASIQLIALVNLYIPKFSIRYVGVDAYATVCAGSVAGLSPRFYLCKTVSHFFRFVIMCIQMFSDVRAHSTNINRFWVVNSQHQHRQQSMNKQKKKSCTNCSHRSTDTFASK